MDISSISKISLEGRDFFVKRDDLIDPYLSGNKYRKLFTLLNTPKEQIRHVVSYGGTQSNAMLAIAALCKKKGWKFSYYTKKMSNTQREKSSGNYLNAITLGMQHLEIEEAIYKDYISSLSVTLAPQTLLVDQGGAVEEARSGLEALSEEIRAQVQNDTSLDFGAIATPSGTGTTALFLALALPEYRIYTTPCVGDVEYLKEQMRALAPIPTNLIILEPAKKYHFAKPYREFYEIYEKLFKQSGIEFDLLYAPGMWLALLDQTQEPVLYLHSGGVSGNESMKERYFKKFKVAK